MFFFFFCVTPFEVFIEHPGSALEASCSLERLTPAERVPTGGVHALGCPALA